MSVRFGSDQKVLWSIDVLIVAGWIGDWDLFDDVSSAPGVVIVPVHGEGLVRHSSNVDEHVGAFKETAAA